MKGNWVDNLEADNKRKAGAPSQSVIYLFFLPIMLAYGPMLGGTYYAWDYASIIR